METKRKSEKGFTLVELTVGIAIMGMMASIAMTSFEKFAGRARQAEAKMALAGMYAAETGFYAEYSSYTECILAGGYAAIGSNRYYLTGFWGADPGNCGDGTQPCFASGYFPTVLCDCTCTTYNATGVNGATWSDTAVANQNLPLLNNCGAGDTQGVPWAWVPSQNTFLVGAFGSISNSPLWDVWQIDDQKNITNVQSGL